MAHLVSWLENHTLPCFFHKYMGISCPGCGFQSSVIALLKGDIVESFLLYPALLPIIVMLAFLPLHIIFKFDKGAEILKGLFIFNTILIVSNYLLKFFI